MAERKEVKIEELLILPPGTIIKYQTFDSDDFHMLTFKVCKRLNDFIYLGGGWDGGAAIGTIKSVPEVLKEINSEDFPFFEIIELSKG